MTTTKPRESLLYMFDPLASPSTPPRSSSSSPESNSDKENDLPRGELTALFNRTYIHLRSCEPQQDTGCLVDVGDVTEGDPWSLVAAGEGVNDHDFLGDVSVMEDRPLNLLPDGQYSSCSSPAIRRIPLAEIEIEETPHLPQCNVPLIREESEESEGQLASEPKISAAPANSPLSQIINSINLSAMSISIPQRSSPLATNSPVCEEDAFPMTPETDTITSPRSELSLAGSNQSPPVATLSSHTPPARLRTAEHSIDPHDSKRYSVDLKSSLSIHMQSPEMSFDLLNDKISFLSHGKDSFWAQGENFNESRDELPAPVAEEPEYRIDDATRIPILEQTTAAPEDEPQNALNAAEDTDSALPRTSPKTLIQQRVESDADQGALHDTHERKSRLCTQNLTLNPPPADFELESKPPARDIASVPALRIIKKPWKIHDRAVSVSSVGSVASAGSSTGSTVVGSDPASRKEVGCGTRKTIPSVPPLCIKRAPSAASRAATITAAPLPSITASRVTNGPARRESVSAPEVRPSLDVRAQEAACRFAAAGIQRPNIKQGERLAPTAPHGKASGVQIGASKLQKPSLSSSVPASTAPRAAPAVAMRLARSATSSGLKQPGRPIGSNLPAPSALPRVASRLPSVVGKPASGASIARPTHGVPGSRLGSGAATGRFK